MSVQLAFDVRLAILLTVAFLSTKSLAENPSNPCPSVFQYGRDGDKGFGLITIRDMTNGETKLECEFSIHGFDTNFAGNLRLTFENDKLEENIKAGNPFTYKIDFFNNSMPVPSDIRFNGVQICSGPKQPEPSCSLTFVHEVTAHTVIVSVPNIPTFNATLEYINSVCGLENGNPIKLSTNGETVVRSRFPWIVAVFKNNRNNDNIEFQCGGSLISTKTIVSVAHCFYDGLTFLRPEEILVSLGRYNLTDLTEGQCLGVDRVIGHPQYNPRAFNSDADVAILLLKKSVLFTLAIIPVCMWQGPSDEVNIQGRTGIIVGWGRDAHRNTTTVPTLVHTTVVSEAQCLRSNAAFTSTTSNRTLCAGDPSKNSGPCTGDAGNGLMIKKDKIWMLRGAVSIALRTPDGRCNVEEYAVYSDVAKFMDWISSNMLL